VRSAATALVRLAVAEEYALLEALQRRASLANVGDRDAILAHPDAIEIPRGQIEAGRVFVAETATGIVGFGAIEPGSDSDSMDLDALFVEPDLWRRGIGRMLVGQCADSARARGATMLTVIGNPHAEGFYHACGFETVGGTRTRFGPGIVMRRRL